MRIVPVCAAFVCVAALGQTPAELVRAGRLEEAAEAYSKLIRRSPEDPSLRLGLAITQYKAGRFRESQAECETALRLRPEFAPALLFLGSNRVALGNAAGAVDPLERYAASQPGDRNGRAMLGDAYLAVSRFADAAKQYRSARLPAKLASALFRAADYAATAEVARDLDSAEGRFLYGASLLNMQRPEEALPVLEAALRLDPKSLPAHAAAGQALLMLGKPHEAIPHLESAAPADEDGSVHFQLAQAYRLVGQPERAAQAAAKHRSLTAR